MEEYVDRGKIILLGRYEGKLILAANLVGHLNSCTQVPLKEDEKAKKIEKEGKFKGLRAIGSFLIPYQSGLLAQVENIIWR